MKILLAIDYSECSKLGVEDLATICQTPTDIHVLHVVEPLPAATSPEARDLEDARKFTKRVVSEITKALPNCTVSSGISVGQPGHQILEAATELEPDLIVMGTHGRNGMSKLLLGSVSQAVLTHAKCGVRIVKPKIIAPAKTSFNVLVATNDSLESDFAFDQLLEMTWPRNTIFHCVTAIKHKSGEADAQQLERQADSWLKCCAVRLNVKLTPLSVTSEILFGDPQEAIVQKAKSWPADLIILGSRAQNVVGRIIRGSVSEAVAMLAPCSVQVMPMQKSGVEYVYIHN